MSVTLRQYPCGHELSLEMLADANRWIMEQIEAQRQAAARQGEQERAADDERR
jgi:hypothetical protein